MAILAFLNTIFLKLVGYLLSVVLLFSGAAPAGTAIEAKEPNVKLQFGVVADVHMETYTLFRFEGFANVLKDMGAAKTKQDALVLVGDNTMNGQPTEYIMLYGLLSQYNKAANTLVAMGNHDLNRSTYKTPDAIARHNFFFQSYTGIIHGGIYYESDDGLVMVDGALPSVFTQRINGYTFIILGDEDPQEDTTATISELQLDWLAGTLKSAPAGKPVFIFLHQQLGHSFGGWGSVGEQSEAIREIIEQYPNVFFFNGHLHRPFEVRQTGGVTYVNLPTLLSGGTNGIGCQVEAYENKVLLRARNYITGQWLGEPIEVAL